MPQVLRTRRLGEIVEAGITLTPALAGTWRWETESMLRFVPETDWPADQRYTVRYERSLFAPGTRLAETSVSFQTAPFTIDIDGLEFYQDPVERDVRKVVASLSLSHHW